MVVGKTINIPSSSSSTHTVSFGDTLWSIASKNGINLNDLISANPNISNVNLIMPGQTINIPSNEDDSTSENDTNTSSEMGNLENEVITLVNQERTNAGLSTLTKNNELTNIARIKSNDFIENNYFSHTSPTYGTPFEMLKNYGISYSAAAENIASGQPTATEVMNSWMSSSGHRANILSDTYNQIGVGVARDSDGKLYWTQLFIKN